MNLYNPLTMENVEPQGSRRRTLCALVILTCFLLFAFGTTAKLVQYWPHINSKLQLSSSCKIEKHHERPDCDRLVMAETPVTIMVSQEPRHWPVPADVESMFTVPFARFISFRPPPAQL